MTSLALHILKYAAFVNPTLPSGDTVFPFGTDG